MIYRCQAVSAQFAKAPFPEPLAPAGVTLRGFRQGQVVRLGAAVEEVPGEAAHELLDPEAPPRFFAPSLPQREFA